MHKFKFIFGFLFCISVSLSQNKTVDSLKSALKKATHDSTRCIILNAMIEAEEDDDLWPQYNEQLYTIVQKNLANGKTPLTKFYKGHLADVLNNKGFVAQFSSKPEKALEYYHQSVKISEEIGDKNSLANTLNNIGMMYKDNGDLETALGYLYRSLKIVEQGGDKERMATYLNNIAYMHQVKGDMLKAIEFYKKSLKLRKEVKDMQGVARCDNNLGNVYYNQGDIAKALEHYHQCLKIGEEMGFKEDVGFALNNIASIYEDQNDTAKAIEYYTRSLVVRKEINDKTGMASCYNNIGNIYNRRGNTKKALDYYQKSLDLEGSIGNKQGVAISLNNIGKVMQKLKDLNKALEYYQKALNIQRECGDKFGMAYTNSYIAVVLFEIDKIGEALTYANEALKLSTELGFPDNIKRSAAILKKIYAKKNNFKEAFEMYELEIKMRDSINNEITRKSTMKRQIQYVYDKKALRDSVRAGEERKAAGVKLEAAEANLSKERTQKLALYGGLAILFIFGALMYNRFKVTKKQKEIIELKEHKAQRQNKIITRQKHLVEEKQTEILDSINYAKRIQYTLLAHADLLNENIPDHFVYFHPKDIVSGDFYWAAKRGSKFYLAVCDSTGHGVPGAFMSLLSISFLNEAITAKGIAEPNKVFDFVRQRLIDNISKEGQKDGFDGILICIDEQTDRITYAAANNKPIIIKNGEMIELEADRMPVGKGERIENFKLYTIDHQKGNVLYLYTDGYADQFGGPKGKKFKYKQLNEQLLSINKESAYSQKEKIKQTFEEWRGDLEQVDDVCLVGIRM